MWLVDLNYNFKCDWLIKLSDNNLASELVKNSSVLNFKPTIIEDIVIFMINTITNISKHQQLHYKFNINLLEWFSIECRKTKTKPVTYQLDFSANLKPK